MASGADERDFENATAHDKGPYRKGEDSPDCDTKTRLKMVVCAKCRFKSELTRSPDGAICLRTDEFCLADYGGIHPTHGTKSPIAKVVVEPHEEGSPLLGKRFVEDHFELLEHVVACSERNPSGKCERFEPKHWWQRVKTFFRKAVRRG
jgi:hypothetical protein